MRKAVKIAGLGCGIILLLAGGLFAWVGWELRSKPANADLPPLTRDLPAKYYTEGQNEFRRRVATQFPIGMPQTELLATLKEQGFTLRGTIAAFHQQAFPCTHGWVIHWTVDAVGRIQNVDSNYNRGCP